MERTDRTRKTEHSQHGAPSRRVSAWTLYPKTLGFVLRRGRYLLIAVLLFLGYWMLRGALNLYAPRVMEKIGWLLRLINTLLLAFFLSFVAGWNKRQYLLGQIGVITSAFMTGTVPEKPFRTGLQMAEDRFHGVGAWKIVRDSLRFLFGSVFRRGRKRGALREQLLRLLQETVSLLILMLAGLFAEFGPCLIAYSYRYPASEVNVRSTLKASRHYFRHFGGVLVQLLLSGVIWAGVVFGAVLPATLGLCKLLEGTAADEAFRLLLLEVYPAMEPAAVGDTVLTVVFLLLVILVSVLVTDPFEKIRAVRFYLGCLAKDGETAEADTDEDLNRLRDRLRERVHGHRERTREDPPGSGDT